MLLLLSPAKSLDYDSPAEGVPHSLPQFVSQSAELIDVLKHKTPVQISELMDLSDNLAALNVARYEAWRPKFTAKNSKQAVLAFNGDVYDGLEAKSLKPKDLEWAQDHVCILSGLYGVLRPLDWMQPYRLEMGTALTNLRGKNLYQFWGASIAQHLNAQLAKEKTPVVVNLASQEYFKAVDQKVLKARVIECVFEEYKGGKYKVISFFAKRARGLLARYAIQKHIQNPEKLKDFNLEGYAYAASESDANRWVFRRREKGAV
jgi:cytoplasmic iron level regulating protein YaaA (DUF328/UPF0246 family)